MAIILDLDRLGGVDKYELGDSWSSDFKAEVERYGFLYEGSLKDDAETLNATEELNCAVRKITAWCRAGAQAAR